MGQIEDRKINSSTTVSIIDTLTKKSNNYNNTSNYNNIEMKIKIKLIKLILNIISIM